MILKHLEVLLHNIFLIQLFEKLISLSVYKRSLIWNEDIESTGIK